MPQSLQCFIAEMPRSNWRCERLARVGFRVARLDDSDSFSLSFPFETSLLDVFSSSSSEAAAENDGKLGRAPSLLLALC